MSVFRTITHKVDFCVVGGGLSGLCAAVEAARRGVKVALMQDRPMLGGNASSEMRMWVLGAHGKNNQETGIIEELFLNNYYRNPYKNFSIWDSIMWEIAKQEKNITLILNCSCMDAEMQDNSIVSVTGWQTTTQMYHTVYARLFADCSGDSVLAPLSGAEYRAGHETRAEFNEDIAPVYADKKTMGMSILIQARETSGPKTYIPPVWAEKYTKEMLPHRIPDLNNDGENFWYLELGGVRDSIADTEELRDELLGLAYGMWDFVKNDPENREKYANFDLDWIGFIPGKRESRRYVGDHILSQEEVRAGGKFSDLIAYGGWTMDDHHPEAFRTTEEPTIYHPAPSPFGIPYRSIYSRNVENLFCAGRNISVSHVALSSTRVMCTCGILGQAAGAAAAVAIRHGETPRGVYRSYIGELQQTLMEDDCWLPGFKRQISKLAGGAKLTSNANPVAGNAEVLRNGQDRPIGKDDNGLNFR
ncbi:MAG: FAD-dependent oxidoreductase, partial [Treponema sp.]|nr:FAD-dependent oxidoreductase [Treponema sp.]